MLFKEGHPDYRTLLADRIYKALFNGGALTTMQNAPRLQKRCAEIQRAFIAEAARWAYLSPSDWATRRDYVLNDWFNRRTSEALSQFRNAGFYPQLDAPVLNKQGGIVTNGFQLGFNNQIGAVYFTLDGSDPRLPGGSISSNALVYALGSSGEVIVPRGSRWRWFTDGVGLGSSDIVVGNANWSAANWKHPAFDDSSWKEGPAQLGYGESDEATVIPYGPDLNRKWTTAYFRRPFTLQNLNTIDSAKMRLKRDDGAIVYINGKEAGRSSITLGPVGASTFADPASDDGQNFNDLAIAVGLLQEGTNIITVELHQATFNTTDASFDLELQATRANGGSQTNSPLVLSKNTVIKARAKDGSEWSALNEAFFQVDAAAVNPSEVLVSEISFDPEGDGSEFMELANYSGHAVNLRGVEFLAGIAFKFPDNRDVLLAPDERLLLVSDLFRFQQKYGNEIPVGGIFAGGLAKEGEQIAFGLGITNLLGNFRYSSGPPWPVSIADTNHTLVLSHPELGLDNPAAWRASAVTNGTPGFAESLRFSGMEAEDADGDGLSALVEYALGTSDQDPNSGPDAFSAELINPGEMVLSYTRNLLADDILFRSEYSEDLIHWSPASIYSTELLGGGIVREHWGIRVFDSDHLFLRLQFVHQ